MSSIHSKNYSTFPLDEMTPEKKWEEESRDYCNKYKIKKTASAVFSLLALYGVTGLSLAAAVTAGKDCPLDKDTNDIHCNGGQQFLGIIGTVLGAWLSIIGTSIVYAKRQSLWPSNTNITKYAEAKEVVKLRKSFLSDDIKDLQKEYHSELPHFHEIGIFFTDEVYTQVCEMFSEQEEISKLEEYLKRFDKNLFENRTDLATLRSQYTKRKETLQNEWTKFKKGTLGSSMPDPYLPESYTKTDTLDSLA